MKVCYVLSRLLPTPSGGVVGGAAANCVSLALELKRRGVEIELFATVSSDGLSWLAGRTLREILRPLQSCDGGLVGKGLGTIHVLRHDLKKRLQETDFDIVHSHSGTYPYAVVPLVADRRRAVRLHSLYCPLGAKGGVYSSWWEKTLVARLTLERLDRVVAVTANVQQSLHYAGVSPEKVELVPMCVDTERFRWRGQPEQTKYFASGGAEVRLLFVGNASQEKGLAELLQVVTILTNRNIPVSLVAAVENQSRIKEYSAGYDLAQDFARRSHLENSVRFVGLVEAIEDLYAEADFLVIPWKTSRGPSDYPMVALEAMAMGRCVVSTPVGGCPELLGGQAGVISRDFSPEAIASALELVIKDRALRSRVEATAVQKAQEFSVRTSADRLINLYEDLRERKTARYARCPV
ncbi:MAG: glycosyltransferase family 4 protein [Sedimentisphaerales bacterium]|nr:glycosyltransferase family 4 protein [Sedimentisphaerales bacterium]